MPKVDIQKITYRIEQAIKELLDEVTTEKFWVTHYGANDIHPKHLVYWICIESDEERRRLTNSYQLNTELKALLVLHNYPIEGRDGVRIGFESQETVDRESGGNWWHHWK